MSNFDEVKLHTQHRYNKYYRYSNGTQKGTQMVLKHVFLTKISILCKKLPRILFLCFVLLIEKIIFRY